MVPGIPQLVEMARRGFIVASVEYRPAPGFHFPTQSDDGWLALEFLREHAEDIWEISNLYINSLNLEYGKQIVGIQPEAALQLKKFPWPQNLVQLKQTLRSALIAAYSFYISSKYLSFILNSAATMNTICDSDGGASIDFSRTLHEIEYQIVNHVLRLENNNQTRAAKRLDIVTVKANGE